MPQKLLNFDIHERLGQGARSTIYAVIDPETHRSFALKHVVRNEPKDIRYIEQMETEYTVSKNLNHPNLRKSFDLKIVKSILMKVQEAYLIMEFVEGRALDVKLPTDLVELTDTFIHAAEGLKAMHRCGYVHCDIKPNNIIRNDAGQVKLIDFGQSCKIGTIKDRIQGTPDYIAPEQVQRKPVTQQTDIFNFGATMYWAFTGGKVIPTLYNVNKQGENSFLVDILISTPAQLNPKLPPVLSNLIMECISTRVSKRPSDMDQIIQRLELAKHVLLKAAGSDAPSANVAV